MVKGQRAGTSMYGSKMVMKGVGTVKRTWVIMCADQRLGSDQGLGTVYVTPNVTQSIVIINYL